MLGRTAGFAAFWSGLQLGELFAGSAG